jgi:NADH:ubiquinone oxidoreductase subunit 5 (subunit L)/multisubunit Na+/H+ antiporter MnhA subunit
MPNSSNYYYTKHLHELPPIMGIVLVSLSFGSIFFGYMAKDIFIGFGSII